MLDFNKNSKFRKSKGNPHLLFTIVLAGFVIGTGLALYRSFEKNDEQKKVSFDMKRCVRFYKMMRTYTLKADTVRGNLWFAANEGVYRFNESLGGWTRFGVERGLPCEKAYDMAIDNKGNAWVGTCGGLALLRNNDSLFVPVQNLKSSPVMTLEKGVRDEIYFYQVNEGLYKFENEALEKITPPQEVGSGIVNTLYLHGKSLIAGFEGKGIFAYDIDSKQWHAYPLERSVSKSTQFPALIIHKGKLWVSTSDEGVWKGDSVRDTLREVKDFPAKGAYCFTEETDGLWCGTPWGLWRYHDKDSVWIQFVNPQERTATDFQVTALFNTEERLWYGTLEIGVGYIYKERVQWIPLRGGLSRQNIRAIGIHKNDLVTGYGYQGGYMDLFNKNTFAFYRNLGWIEGLKDQNIQTISYQYGKFYFGGFDSFGEMSIDSENIEIKAFPVSQSGIDIAIIEGGREDSLLYLGSLGGVMTFNVKKQQFKILPGTEGYIVRSLKRVGSSLWIGSLRRGLLEYDLNKNEIIKVLFDEDGGFSSIDTVDPKVSGGFDIVAAGQNKIYLLSSKSNSIENLYPFTTNPKELAKKKQKTYEITSMKVCDNQIWIGTDEDGCAVYDFSKKTYMPFTYYQGLISDHVKTIQNDSSYIWVGCFGGVNRLDKSLISDMWKSVK